MPIYLLRRLLWIVPVVFASSVVTFALMHAAPGSPWNRERPLDPDLVAQLNERFGLDQPIAVQYVRWLWNVAQGDFGSSLHDPQLVPNPSLIGRQELATLVVEAIGPSLQLALMAFGLALLAGVALGVVAAYRHDTWVDHVATGITLLGMAAPAFLLGVVLQVVFGEIPRLRDGLFPMGGWESPRHWVMPTVALAGLPMALIARFTRSAVLEAIGDDYVRTAHSKGLSDRRIAVVHILRNALIPVVSVLGPILAILLTGAIVIEIVFDIPGVGSLYFRAVRERDYPVIMAMTLIYTIAVAGVNLVVDLFYGVIDPRIREEAAR